MSPLVNQRNIPIDIWNHIKKTSNDFELTLDRKFRRDTGSYYTGLDLAAFMVNELLADAEENFVADLSKKTFLEPCVGTGNFVFAFLRKVFEQGYSNTDVHKIINNIYVCDSNKEALHIYSNLLRTFVYSLWKFKINDEYFDLHIGGSLLYDVTHEKPSYIFLEEVFSREVMDVGFDIIITNPPYKNLKAERNKAISSQQYEQDKERYALISADVKRRFLYSNDGVLNLYKLFVEKIITEYTKEKAYVSLLVPSTILSDKTCEKIRTYILNQHRLSSVNVIRENNPFINAQQSLCTMLIEKNRKTTSINIAPDFCKEPAQKTSLLIDDVLSIGAGNAIFSLPPKEYETLRKLRSFPTVKGLPFIVNMRGELDLTENRDHITMVKTSFPLIRGKNIGYFSLSSDPCDYVNDSFIEKTNKRIYIERPRIVCQQVVNIHKDRRVTFSYIREGFVLGNSCNFISVEENEYGIDLFALLGLFNSPVINWFFKLTSTNNHLNNYEIDAFPIPLGSPLLKRVSEITRKYLQTKDSEMLNLLCDLSYECYGMSHINQRKDEEHIGSESVMALHLAIKKLMPEISLGTSELLLNGGISFETVMTEHGLNMNEFSKRTCNHMINKHQKIRRNEVMNHISFKLSDLDMEMVKAVPQGGNWKDIPDKTVSKSQRLLRIKETGGRTTLYGRIDYKKPAYTITTYFNRPGNGSYIHPLHNRVISVREAARLQSFRDDYFFYGNKTDLLKQVGNAVPPLLAYQIGKSVINKTGCKTSLDLFCGAGGMTLGFKEAGMNTVLGVDIDRSSCITFKANNPEIEVICDDITKTEVKEKIISYSLNRNVDIVCGGPPCQGFSHAGKRFIDDPRNELFRHFIEVVSGVNPKVVIMENVEGMLTFQQGAVYRQINELFKSLGYRTKGKMLHAHKYSVPQKRKRVIIICTKEEINIDADDLFPTEITERERDQVTAFDAISDLESVPCSDDAKYPSKVTHSDFMEVMIGQREFGYFIDIKSQTAQANIQYKQILMF